MAMWNVRKGVKQAFPLEPVGFIAQR